MLATSAGNVGIGTSSPTYKLDVQASGYPAVNVASTSVSGANGAGINNKNGGGAVSFFGTETTTGGYSYTNAIANAAYIGSGGANPLQLVTNSIARATLDSAGNLGLGVTPSAWYSSFNGFDLSTAGAISGSVSGTILWGNSFINASASERYKTNGFAVKYVAASDIGAHIWQIAPSGTAGNAITFTEAMRLDASGRLGIGVTSPGAPLDVYNSTSQDIIALRYSTLGKVAGVYLDSDAVYYGGGATNYTNAFSVSHQHNYVAMNTAGSERARIDSSGQLLLGTTTPVATGAGSLTVGATTASTSTTSGALQVAGGLGVGGNSYFGGTIYNTYTGGYTGAANIQFLANPASGAAYIGVQRASSSSGESGYAWRTNGVIDWLNFITTSGTSLAWYNPSYGTVMTLNSTGVLQLNTYGAGTLVTNSSGIISASSDVRLKNVKHAFTTGLKAITQIHPAVYSWKSEEKEGVHTTYAGFIAQDVKEAIPEAVGQGKDGYLTLQDRAITAALVNAIKEQQKEIEDLQQQIKQLSKQP